MGNNESVQLNAPSRNVVGAVTLTYNGHRISRRIEDDYVDVTPEMESLSREEMEDQFVKIVVRQ